MHRRHAGTAVGLVTVAALVLAGPVACSRPRDRGIAVQTDRTQAMLTSARASGVTFFGDTRDGRRGGYFTRSGTSLGQHTFSETGADFDVDIDSTGQRLVFASTRHNVNADIYLKSVDGVAVTQLTSDPAPDIQPVFSPDNERVAFASYRSGTWDIWIVNINGDPPVQVTGSAADEIHPSWSPDGTRLVYSCLPADGGQWELWVVDATAGGQRRFIGYGLFPEWSPTSDTILFQRARDQGQRLFSIWTVELVGDEPRYPTEVASAAQAAMILPAWSHDGASIAFARVDLSYADHPSAVMAPGGDSVSRGTGDSLAGLRPSGAFDIWVMQADGRGMTRLTDGFSRNYGPTFAPDGRVYFTSDRSGFENVWSVLPGRGLKGGDVASGPARTRTGVETRVGVVKDGL